MTMPENHISSVEQDLAEIKVMLHDLTYAVSELAIAAKAAADTAVSVAVRLAEVTQHTASDLRSRLEEER